MLRGLIAIFFVWVLAQTVQAQTLALTEPTQKEGLVGYVYSAVDPQWQFTVEDVARNNPDMGFLKIATREIDHGYTPAAIWVKVSIRNDTPQDTEWRVLTAENFLQVIEFYAVRENGRIDTLLVQTPDSPFSSRSVPFGQVTAPLTMQPDETIELVIKYHSGGSSNMSFALETDASFAIVAASTMAKNTLFYGMMILLIAFALAGMIVLRQPMLLGYAGYSGAVLMYLMHSDGVAFQYLWPNAPWFNNNASIFIGSAVCITAASWARVFVQTKLYHIWVDRILLSIILFTFGLLIGSAVIDTQVIKKMLVLTSLVSVGMCLVAGLVASRTRFKQVRFFVIAWAGAVLSAGLMSLRHWIGVDVSQQFQYDSMRFVMVFDASLMGMAIIDHYNQLRDSRQSVVAANLKQARRNLSLNKRLAGLEKQYATMIERNHLRDLDFTNTIHDLRQPIHALRMNISGLEKDGSASNSSESFEDTFDYLENLISTELTNSKSRLPKDDKFASDKTFSLPDTLKRVHMMFQSDAAEKGLSFRLRTSSDRIHLDAFILQRILSNLVENAVKYTDQGRVCMGSTSINGQVHVYVADTGLGMTPEEFAAAQERTVRLDDARSSESGFGYGLAIAKSLATDQGWVLQHKSRRKGTLICLTIGRANVEHSEAN